MSAGTTGTSPSESHVYLLARTPFKQFLDFMATEPVDAQSMDRKALADEWRAANSYIRSLQDSEATWADNPPILPLPDSMDRLLPWVRSDPICNKAFSTVPIDFGFVELDRLVVRQKSINLCHVQRIKEQLGSNPNDETVFRLCMPYDHPTPAFRYGSSSDNGYVFISESNDIRFLDSVVLRPQQIRGFQASGPIVAALALVVGFGSNYLNAIAAEGRLVLNNGSHRAYALRTLGRTHVPCLIQRVTTREELLVVAAGALKREPELYLTGPRPPVLKDYFDSRLFKFVECPRRVRHIRLRFTTETVDLPDHR